jgi:hypothetical protein
MKRPKNPAKPPPARLGNAEAQVKVARINRSTNLCVAIVGGVVMIAVAAIKAGLFHGLWH